ncbi:sperm microtubule inner protein 11 isoform X2 [Heteronotia binoei]|uniref:sperm microtubule inner protein 11 isoform X2 n=1 Tax=Heteronotia binoei TaxID=13085 RepID=UPI00292DC50B|nr:sperm microtubule inner protein 11 isoform X2 [Heteronotia binoei]
MAFFGLTYVGYQEPFQQKKLQLAKYEVPGTPQPKLDFFYPKLPPIGAGGYDGTEHRGSNCRYREAVRRRQLKKYPNQVYRVPMTCGQDIGWWLPSDPSVKPEDAIPWIKAERHSLKQTTITKFVENMLLRDPLFSLF